jgi:colicin import membrane protein
MIAPPRLQHVSAGGLALLMHGLLLLALMIGVSWKNPPQLPIEAEMWVDLPDLQPSIPAAEFAPMPEQLPEPEPAPEALPQPKAEPKSPLAAPPKPQPDQAQIALEKAEKKRAKEVQLELQMKQELKLAEEKRVEALRKAELERVEAARMEAMRVEATRIEKDRQEKLLAEQEKREQSRRLIDQELARQMRDELAAESSQLNAMQSRSRVSGQARMVLDAQERIRAKIRDALIMPKSLKGDAEVIFQVSLLPNGEVVRVTLIKTSGQPLYDGAVERAIFKASPLPLPSDRQAAQQFRDGLTLKFRPSDDADKFN